MCLRVKVVGFAFSYLNGPNPMEKISLEQQGGEGGERERERERAENMTNLYMYMYITISYMCTTDPIMCCTYEGYRNTTPATPGLLTAAPVGDQSTLFIEIS